MGTALIELGNAGNQVVQGCRLYDTRSWSTLHLREGDRLQCSGALVEDNDIGPCGEEWDESYDGKVSSYVREIPRPLNHHNPQVLHMESVHVGDNHGVRRIVLAAFIGFAR